MRLSLDEAVALFLRQNLDLLMAKYGIESAKGQQITARLFPNPTASLGTLSAYTQGRNLGNSGQLFAQVQQLFELAGKRLGADVINMQTSASSVAKGETLIDTASTLNAMRPDILVVRHQDAGAGEQHPC